MFSSKVKDGDKQKDTARNIASNGEFVVNVVTEHLAEQMDQTSVELAPEESEFDFGELDRAESTYVKPPRVAEAVIAMECIVIKSLDIYDRSVFFGEVETFHIDDSVLVNGKVEMDYLDTVGRLGGPYYTSVERIELTRRF